MISGFSGHSFQSNFVDVMGAVYRKEVLSWYRGWLKCGERSSVRVTVYFSVGCFIWGEACHRLSERIFLILDGHVIVTLVTLWKRCTSQGLCLCFLPNEHRYRLPRLIQWFSYFLVTLEWLFQWIHIIDTLIVTRKTRQWNRGPYGPRLPLAVQKVYGYNKE